MRFSVLASGSSANVSLLEINGQGLLLDVGLGPRQIESRLEVVGFAWEQVRAVLLTHIHGDHWKEPTLVELAERRLPLFCHPDHARALERESPAWGELKAGGLVRHYHCSRELNLGAGLKCRPLELSHDAGVTCGFRFDTVAGASLGYVADLGCWNDELVRSLAGVDALALEFNHDVAMQKTSGRPAHLIARVLGDQGHLSNAQAAELLEAVLGHSPPGRLRHVVQLHLSRQCNRPKLARNAAQACVERSGSACEVHTAKQDEPGPSLDLGAESATLEVAVAAVVQQGLLPGWDDGVARNQRTTGERRGVSPT